MKIRFNRYFIPNFISSASILSGFIAIIMASYNEIQFAALMILLGAFFDGIDGKVARALKATNDIGKEMDSLADLVTFGIAPGYLLFMASLYKFGNWGILISATVPICAAIRLARFNIKPTKTYFVGVPSTWAGISIAVLQGFYNQFFPNYFYIIYALGIAILMVSDFKYYKPDKQLLKMNTPKYIILGIFILLLIINYRFTILLFIFAYTISGILVSFRRPKSKDVNPYKIKL